MQAAARMSQLMFARPLGLDKSTVAQLERRAKQPSGPTGRLEVLDLERREESPVVRVQRAMAPAPEPWTMSHEDCP